MIPHFTALGAGPTILMLHGSAGGHSMFAPQLESLAHAGYRAVAWDMPGYGHSAPVEPYQFKGLAERCASLIEALMQPLGGGAVVLMGHEIGSLVALELALRRPHLVSRLILSGNCPGLQHAESAARATRAQDYLQQRLAPLDAGLTMGDLGERLIPQLIGPGALPEGVQLATRCMAQVNAIVYRRALEALVLFDRAADLARIGAPTLLVEGAFDAWAPAPAQQAMAQALPGSVSQVMPGIGHWPNLEAPEEFDALVLDFLAAARRLH